MLVNNIKYERPNWPSSLARNADFLAMAVKYILVLSICGWVTTYIMIGNEITKALK